MELTAGFEPATCSLRVRFSGMRFNKNNYLRKSGYVYFTAFCTLYATIFRIFPHALIECNFILLKLKLLPICFWQKTNIITGPTLGARYPSRFSRSFSLTSTIKTAQRMVSTQRPPTREPKKKYLPLEEGTREEQEILTHRR